ncbi:sugar ABC transporter ATP-binding protein [Eoetvoesiella caeni]
MVTETTGTARTEPANAQPIGLLQVRRLTKSFGATQALADVSLTFREGEIHCLLGENGAGKSTIGKIIGGLYTRDDGEILFRGQPVSVSSIAQARALGIAVVYQELSLAPDLSVRANLQLGRQGAGQPFVKLKHAQEAHESMQILRRLGLDDIDLEQRTGDLPVATQQLIEIGKALLLAPKLVIFDEPTAMLGAVETQKFFNVLRTLRQEGTASVLITHHIEDVMAVGDRISIMRNGRLVDSFPAGPGIDEDTVLERLTGKKSHAATARRNAPGAGQFLRIDNVTQRNGDQASLSARKGEIVGFYGVVGCGAEKILHGLAGLTDAQPLQFTLDNMPYRPRSTAQAFTRGVSYLPSGRAANGIFATRSIRENIVLTQLSKLSKLGIIQKRAERDITQALLKRYRVKYQDADNLITSLSGGNQQKVLLARAIARAEKMLLLEEPTIGIDVDAKHEIHECIKGLAETGVTVVLLSCDLIETIALCDTIFTMYGGRVVQKYTDPVLDDQASIVSDVLGQHIEAKTAQTESIESQGV